MSTQPPFDGDQLDRAEEFFTGEPVPEEFQSLVDSAEQEVHGWNPKQGDTVFGQIVDISEAESEFGSYPLITIRTPSAKLVGVHCFHAVLKNEITRRLKAGRLEIGDDIAINYRGEGVATAGRNAPNMYRVSIRPQK